MGPAAGLEPASLCPHTHNVCMRILPLSPPSPRDTAAALNAVLTTVRIGMVTVYTYVIRRSADDFSTLRTELSFSIMRCTTYPALTHIVHPPIIVNYQS